MFTNSILGIDIGASQLKIVRWNGSEITDAILEPMPEHMVKDGRILSYPSMGDLIKTTLRRHRMRGRHCAVIVPSTHLYLRRVTVPFMTQKQLRTNLPYEFRDFLSHSKDCYFFDYQVNEIKYDEVGTAKQMDLTIAAVEKSVIQDYRSMLRRAGLKLITAVPAECACTNLLRNTEQELPKTLCVLDLGQTGTRLHLFTDGTYEATRVIDIGLGSVNTEAPTQTYQRMALEIRRAINFYSFQNPERPLEQIRYTGGGACIPDCLDILGDSLDQPLHPIASLLPSSDRVHADSMSLLAAATGTAMQKKETHPHKRTLNLAQKELHEFSPLRLVPSCALILILTLVFSKFGVTDRLAEVNAYSAEVAELQAQVQTLKEATTDFPALIDEYNRYSTHSMTEEERALISRTEILHLLEQSVMTVGTLHEFSISGNTLQIDLLDTDLQDISTLIENLYHQPHVTAVRVQNISNPKEDDSRISMTVEFGVPEEGGDA